MKKLLCLPLPVLLCLTMASAQAASQQPTQGDRVRVPSAVSGARKGAAEKPQPPDITMILDRSLQGVESEFVSAAEAMPEDKFSYAPTDGEFKGVRNFGQQVKHVAAANYMIAAAILGEKPPVELGGENGPDSIKSKPDMIKFLKESFAYTHRAFQSIHEDNATGQVQSPFGPGKATRLGLAVLNVGHCFDHYGQMVEYLRSNGIIPPASRPRQR